MAGSLMSAASLGFSINEVMRCLSSIPIMPKRCTESAGSGWQATVKSALQEGYQELSKLDWQERPEAQKLLLEDCIKHLKKYKRSTRSRTTARRRRSRRSAVHDGERRRSCPGSPGRPDRHGDHSRPVAISRSFHCMSFARRMMTCQAISSSTTVMSICDTGSPGGSSIRIPGP